MISKLRLSYIVVTLSVAVAPLAMSQTLSEEVVIDRDITPEVRPLVRPSWVMPAVMSPRLENRHLSFYEFASTSDITRSVPMLEPIVWADSVMRTPYRGYASLGYFPIYNLGGAAGYRFIRTEKIDAGANISYDGSSWNGYEKDETKFKQNKVAVGLDGDINLGKGRLLADFNYIYSATDGPETTFERGLQAINIIDLGVRWKSLTTSRFVWGVSADFGYGGFTRKVTYEPVKDLTFGIGGDMSYNLSESSAITLDVDADFRSLNNAHILLPGGLDSHFSETLGIIALTPAYKFNGGKFGADLGVRFDIATGTNCRLHVAPEVGLHWTPSPFLSVYGRATGGEVMNTNRELWERNPWMLGSIAQERSHINADVELGLVFGSFKGIWAKLYGGWSSVSDWATPVTLVNINTWSPASIKGFNFGFEAGYSWQWLTVTGHVLGATHRRYYRWQDNAKWDVGVEAKMRPISRLNIGVGYETRISRQAFVFDTVGNEAYVTKVVSLGHTSNLFVGAEYEITDAIGVFVKGENLLNRHWNLVPGVRSMGIHGLVGAQYKF